MVVVGGIGREERDGFEDVLRLTAGYLEGKNQTSTPSPSKFEHLVKLAIEEVSEKEGMVLQVELVSGARFPDIVCRLRDEDKVGVEVKHTVADKWECIGNSINESTRIDQLRRIYLMFGNFGGGRPKVRFARYQDVLQDIRITHFPRYYINMDISPEDTIFSHMDTDYDLFRNDGAKYKKLKKYYRSKLKRGEELWWIDNDATDPNVIRLWKDIDKEKREVILAEAFILFTEIFRKDRKKYNRLASWLVARHQVVSPSLRDDFSAGGQEKIKGVKFPRIVFELLKNMEKITDKFGSVSTDDIGYYWDVGAQDLENTGVSDLFGMWKTKVLENLSYLSEEQTDILKEEIAL